MSLDVSLYEGPPCDHCQRFGHSVFWRNITHNLTEMADACGVYEACWRPKENGYRQAKQILPILKEGLRQLNERPEHFAQYDAPNGWGRVGHLQAFLAAYIQACEENPDAEIEASR